MKKEIYAWDDIISNDFQIFQETGRQRLFTTAVNRVTLKGRGTKTDESLCEIRTKSLISSPNFARFLLFIYYASSSGEESDESRGEREISDFNQSGNWFWNEPLYVHTYLFQI